MKLVKEVYAHCDIPCGIYSADLMKSSAETCRRVVHRALELDLVDNSPEKMNTFVRCVTTKEEHAEIVKRELMILWADYFKPEHLERFPDLHEMIWKTIKQASVVKQTLDMSACDMLINMIRDVEKVFVESKQP